MIKYINANDVYDGMRKHGFEAKYITRGEFVDHLPSADVRENIHGEWKHNKNNDVIKCSECGFGIMDSTFVWEIRNCCGTIEDNPFNFCPNCGANM